MTGGPLDRPWIDLPLYALDVPPQTLDLVLHYGKVLSIGMDSGAHFTNIRTNALKHRVQGARQGKHNSYDAQDQSDFATGDERSGLWLGSTGRTGWWRIGTRLFAHESFAQFHRSRLA